MVDYKKLLKIKDTRESLARGAAVGFFWGLSMFWGAQILGAIIFAQLLKGNKVLAAAMTAISNPITTIPLYTGCYVLGHLFVPGPDLTTVIENIHSFSEMIKLGGAFFLSMFIGTTLVGIIGALIIYFALKKVNYGSVDSI